MKLLFKRSQGRSMFNKPIFRLHAKVDLENEEMTLINRYQMNGSVLIHVEQPDLFRNSALFGLLIFCISYLIIAFNFWRAIGLGMMGVILMSFLIAVICGYVFYHQNRETIYLKDLIVGRYFQCRSVVDLARREAWLEGVTAYLRQVVESAKYWGGTEVREIPVLPKDEALKLIARG